MARKRSKKQNAGKFAGVPVSIMATNHYTALSSNEKALLFELAFQYNGYNNGNLTACHSVMKKRGWASASLWRAYSGLVHAGFAVVTRQGFKRRGYPTLLGLTYQPIDEPPAKVRYDEGVQPSQIPLSFWCKAKSSWSIQPELKAPVKKLSTSN
jgi:hypothetical protein